MKTGNVIAMVAVAMAALIAAVPGEAQTYTTTKKLPGKRVPALTYARPATRVTVRRPFTDPGTETLPLAEHYADYAFPPTYTPFPDQGGIVGFWRAPLPSPIDLPGYNYWTH
jgi:hypothetical protein